MLSSDGGSVALSVVPQDVILGNPVSVTNQKRKQRLNIILERFFQFERVTLDHLTVPFSVHSERVTQITFPCRTPHSQVVVQHRMLTTPLVGMHKFHELYCSNIR